MRSVQPSAFWSRPASTTNNINGFRDSGPPGEPQKTGAHPQTSLKAALEAFLLSRWVSNCSRLSIVPTVIVAEAMAQVAAVLVSIHPDAEGQIAHLASIEHMRFRRPVRPGDQLITHVVALRGRGRFGKAQVTATVNGAVAANGRLTYGLVSLDEMS